MSEEWKEFEVKGAPIRGEYRQIGNMVETRFSPIAVPSGIRIINELPNNTGKHYTYPRRIDWDYWLSKKGWRVIIAVCLLLFIAGALGACSHPKDDWLSDTARDSEYSEPGMNSMGRW